MSSGLYRMLPVLGALGALATAAPRAARAERVPLMPYLSSSAFETIAQEKGVRVYKHRSSEIIRIGAEGLFPAPPERVKQALLDYSRQVGAIERLSEARVLSRGERSLYVYQRLNLPVIDDRDFVLNVRHGADGDKRWVSYWAVTDRGPPPRDGVVRVTNHRGTWVLEPADDGHATRVRYQVSIDLGGLLPRWMARAGAGRELPALFGAICRLSRPDRRHGRCP